MKLDARSEEVCSRVEEAVEGEDANVEPAEEACEEVASRGEAAFEALGLVKSIVCRKPTQPVDGVRDVNARSRQLRAAS